MPLVIPTYGRANRQKTWGNLPKELQQYTFLAVQSREAHLYEKFPHLIILPDEIRDIATTRDYLVRTVFPEHMLIMMDDDLEFAVRRSDDKTKFKDADGVDVAYMVQHIYD